MKKYFLLLSLALAGCSKPDPHPEIKDPIFNDLNAELALVSSSVDAERVALKKFEEELAAVVPQSGQIKYSVKRVEDSKAKLQKLEQQKKYLELKVGARKSLVQKEYLKAYQKKQAWPDPQEWQSYQLEKKLRAAKRTWDVKERMKEAGVGLDISKKAGGGHSEAPPASH